MDGQNGQSDIEDQQREVVNGALLAHSVNKPVNILGVVTNINPNGRSFEMRTVDNMMVTVNLPTPLDDMVDGYVEVHGTCQSRNTVRAEEYIQFSVQQTDDFDVEGHSKLCALLQQIQNPYDAGSDEPLNESLMA